MKLCISNGRIIDPSQEIDGVGNLWIEDGKIIGMDFLKEFPQGFDRRLDASGSIVAPGFIDLHVHLRDPGETYKEDIVSGSQAAARGGFTTICAMPNTKPVVDNEKVLRYIDERAKEGSGVNVFAIGAITEGQLGKKLSRISSMIHCDTKLKKIAGKGICALSEDGKSVEDKNLYLKAMKKANKYGLPIFSHAEAGKNPESPEGELEGVKRDLELARREPCRLHFCHISTKKSLDAIENARREGLNVTCETAPHYFSLTRKKIETDGNFKMNPPLRTIDDKEAIKLGLRSNSIQAIATDHAPHSIKEKEGAYEEALNGIIGLETALAIGYTELVHSGFMSVLELIDKMSYGPAKILGINRGTFALGSPADITIFETRKKYIINKSEFASKSSNTPFEGMEVWGRILTTIVDGAIIYSSGKLIEGK